MKSFDWVNPYPSVRIPLFARNVVSTSHPLAAQAGSVSYTHLTLPTIYSV